MHPHLRGGQTNPKLTGTWLFNEKLSATTTTFTVLAYFSNQSTEYTSMSLSITGLALTKRLFYINDGGTTTVFQNSWLSDDYRTITFTQPFFREANADFYDWFIANATKQS